VASRVGGVPELVREGDGGNGILAPPDDPDALARALAQAADRTWDPKALRGTVESLSWDQVGDRYWEILQEVVQAWKAGG
jgi:glycosyltransferase involved in cell wall biosynthesis